MSKSTNQQQKTFPVHAAACSYRQQGLSVIPICTDGSKQPAVATWNPYRDRRATALELRAWFHHADPCGIGIVTGPISGNLVVLDFDDRDCYDAWKAVVKQKRPNLWAKLVRIATPSGGRHVYFRLAATEELQRLPHVLAARRRDETLSPEEQPRLTLCELKFNGRYVVAPGSPTACHPTHRVYRELAGTTIAQVKCLSKKSVEFLVRKAQRFDQRPPRRFPKHPGAAEFHRVAAHAHAGERPGDEFEVIMNWDEILEPHGWHFQEGREEVEYWCRPGKDDGISASINYQNCGLLYVFSTNAAPLVDNQAYTKFAAFAELNHGGDFTAAAAALARQGYGRQTQGRVANPDHRRWDHLRELLECSRPPSRTGGTSG